MSYIPVAQNRAVAAAIATLPRDPDAVTAILTTAGKSPAVLRALQGATGLSSNASLQLLEDLYTQQILVWDKHLQSWSHKNDLYPAIDSLLNYFPDYTPSTTQDKTLDIDTATCIQYVVNVIHMGAKISTPASYESNAFISFGSMMQNVRNEPTWRHWPDVDILMRRMRRHLQVQDLYALTFLTNACRPIDIKDLQSHLRDSYRGVQFAPFATLIRPISTNAENPTPADVAAALNITLDTADPLLKWYYALHFPNYPDKIIPAITDSKTGKTLHPEFTIQGLPRQTQPENPFLNCIFRLKLAIDKIGANRKPNENKRLHRGFIDFPDVLYRRKTNADDLTYRLLSLAIKQHVPFFDYYLSALVDFCRLLESNFGKAFVARINQTPELRYVDVDEFNTRSA
jgi:hypothetical protein